MQHTVGVEMLVQMNKAIYEATPWNTREKAFHTAIIEQVDSDLNFFKRNAQSKDGSAREDYENFIKCLAGMKHSITKSLQCELLNVDGNIEEVKVKFEFPYYDTSIISVERTVESFIFITPVQDNYKDAEDFSKALESIEDMAKKQNAQNVIKLFEHAAEFMEQAKTSLVIYKDGVALETAPFPKTNKLGM